MRILISGASGFIGKKLFNYLKDCNHIVHTVGRNKEDTFKVDLSKNYFEIIESYDLIIHSAGLVHKKEHAYKFSDKFYQIDQQITNNFLKCISNSQYKKLVLLSSISVYGLESGIDISEFHKCNPQSSYGQSKIYSEQKFIKFDSKRSIILRLPLVYGSNPKGNLARVLENIRKRRMILFRPNKAIKSVLNVQRLCEIIENDLDSLNGVYNLKSRDVNFNEFIQEMSNQINNGKIYYLPIQVFAILKFLSKFISKNLSATFNKINSSLTISDRKYQDSINAK